MKYISLGFSVLAIIVAVYSLSKGENGLVTIDMGFAVINYVSYGIQDIKDHITATNNRIRK